MEQTPKTIYLKDYTPPPFWIDKVNLHFELGEESTTVTSLLKIRRNGDDSEPLELNGQDQTLNWVKLNGQMLDDGQYTLNADLLSVQNLPDVFELEIQSVTEPQNNTSLEGLYKSSGNFCTQCEAEGFRKITFYLDRPDVMALFTTTIVADKQKYPVLLSNGNLVGQGEIKDGRHWAKWHDPFKKPCYLFALVAGRLECIEDSFTTMSGHDVRLQIFVESHNVDKCDHAMRSLKRAMQWDEEVYGREYDLDIYMIVAVDDFNMGAMENKGLNVFNSKYVLARPDTATDDDYIGIESVIAHEYFHNWSGNRVTCRDWFQLSLKEGFTVFRDQEFTADMFSHAVKRIDDVNRLRSYQFIEDAGPMAHPVRPESYVEINNFYTLTVYEKGAEVVRMIHNLLGKDGFRKGCDIYFDRHDGQAVTTDDFVAAMEEGNDVDLGQFKRWYNQAGTPVIQCESSYDTGNNCYTLNFKQSCPSTPGQDKKIPFHIPIEIGLISSEGNDLPLQIEAEETVSVLELTAEEQSFEFVNVTAQPIPSLLRHFSAPVKIEYDYTAEELAFLMAHDSDEFNRWNAGQQLAMQLLHKLIEQYIKNQCFNLEPVSTLYSGFSGAFLKLLRADNIDLNFKAAALILPSENYIAGTLSVVDPIAVHEARRFISLSLASEHGDALLNVYNNLCNESDYQIDAQSMGQRAVKNTCLSYLSKLEDKNVITLCYKQFESANNMTDSMAALRCLTDIQCSQREQSLEAFYNKWRDDALVVDKWLGLQAVSRLPNALSKVKALMNHEAFNLKNPNKIRALIGSFVGGNSLHFHAADGEGYCFLADQVIDLDKLNPQISARMVNPLIHWRRYGAARQQMMKDELIRISKVDGLSNDVYEIVTKGLAQ